MIDERKIAKILQSYPDHTWISSGVPEYRIAAAEQQLGMTFPGEYKRFLASYGTIRFGSLEIYGMLPDNPHHIPNGIWATGYLREIKALPEKYIVIGFDGFGGYYCLDTGALTGADSCPVIVIDLNEPVTEDTYQEKLADSFIEFLFREMKEEARSFHTNQ